MPKTILVIGAFDTKGAEFAFLRQCILDLGHRVLMVNTGVMGTTELFPVDVEAEAVAREGGARLEALRAKKDRGEAMKAMSQGTASLVRKLYDQGRFDGIIGMGGTGGTSVVSAGMRGLPLGVPKICVSTAAGGDTSSYVGTKDIAMIPAIVDVAGLNRISRPIFAGAAGAICGMAAAPVPAASEERPIVVASMFGNTTTCVNVCAEALGGKGYEVLIFHATGAGGRTMESLVAEGVVDAVLDITTTEWADTLCGGVFHAGPERLSAPGQRGVPHLIVPGCVDMVNFGPMSTVPQPYCESDRLFYEWNPAVTLMRTNSEENRRLGEIFAEKANQARGPVAFLLPLRGVSILDGEGQPFCDWEADQALFAALKKNLKPGIRIVELNCNINDPQFSSRAVEMMLEMIEEKKRGKM
ncbi:MAG: Tm-1-like ATP-binding domain-containing protein [Candidatus Handelsmanbacteria bacterium]|nr:Tm-1-like ATP-binding domain-containing protein [Candidatus Handelsmanbacteria bacterium]